MAGFGRKQLGPGAALQVPGGDGTVRADESPTGQRAVNALSHVTLQLGFDREQRPNPDLVADAFGHVGVRSERAGRLMLPMPAQGDRHGGAHGGDVGALPHAQHSLVGEGLSHQKDPAANPSQ